MIIGAHTVIFSKDPDADRAFFRDILRLPNVDAGDGWLIFALPQSEVAMHPTDKSGASEFFLMCDDVHAFMTKLKKNGIKCTKATEQGWGLLTTVTLPGGGKVGVYQPRHKRPGKSK
jgi:catechol 2,3-dioxygenase-like lactoylglutathione lyase family enzyme